MAKLAPNHILTHEAMATRFTLRIAYQSARYARQAAAEAFAELDRIDQRLSRFVESSDVARIRGLRAGQSVVVQLDTFECLRIALEVQRETGGAFDVAYASPPPTAGGSDSLPIWAASAARGLQASGADGTPIAELSGPPAPTRYSDNSGTVPVFAQRKRDCPLPNCLPNCRFRLSEETHTVCALIDAVRLDLGGIGKGFALDRMAAILAEWEIDAALLSASTSTLLALAGPPGEPGWPITFGPDSDPRRVRLAHWAVSGSGRSVMGDHIIDPRTGRPARGCVGAWAAARTAALADALSTALMIMPDAEIRSYCQRHPEVSAYVQRSASQGQTCFGRGLSADP